MEKEANKPSRLAWAFFHWYCHPEFREEIEGDLMERFHTHSEKYGHAKANRLFIKDVILLFRPAIIGNIYQLTHMEPNIIRKQNKRIATIAATVSALLLVPLVAMNFTDEVNWKVLDFLVAGILLGGTGLTLEFILRKVKTKGIRITLVVVLFLVLFMIWAELAVGIFGTVFAGS